ncbi:MAG: tyrosine-type recombinase/integrase [Burkholderiales bacterium]|nr:tyrosine-type recombinase/integrase [Burkholderiales bacterium]
MQCELQRRIQFLALRLRPGSARHYRVTARNFLRYLHLHFPRIRHAHQLRRDPHLLGWMQQLATRQPPLSISARIGHLLCLRRLLEDLQGPGLLLPEDIPRADHYLPRPLPAEDDALLQRQLRAIDDVRSNALLLLRATGLRIGELVDLPADCLHRLGDGDGGAEQWALRVPLGKLHSERWIPVDRDTRAVVARMLALGPAGRGYLLPRPPGRAQLGRNLRRALTAACQAAGCSGRYVPHQLRHTCATGWLRRGMSLPAVMKLLGHTTPEMTMLYIEVTQTDLQQQFLRASLHSPHELSAPLPPARAESLAEALRSALLILDASRTQTQSKLLDAFRRRILRLINAAQKLNAS